MKKTLYPKTPRVWNDNIIITEKLDGSNLWLFKINWKLLIAQRNNCFYEDELEWENLYKWLFWWIKENKDKINLCEWSWIFGEWIWMWKIWYWESLNKRFYIFAKANIDENLEVRSINYNSDLFIYPFESQKIPECIWVVPLVDYTWPTDIDSLDILYNDYCNKVNRQVEWFIMNNNNIIKKYVRHKNWQLTEHYFNKNKIWD